MSRSNTTVPIIPALVHHVEPPVEGDGPGVAEGLVEGRAEGPQRLVLRGRVQVQRRADHVQILSMSNDVMLTYVSEH